MNRLVMARYITTCGIVVAALLLVFDKIWVPDSSPYYNHRLISILLFCGNLYFIGLVSRIKSASLRRFAGGIALLLHPMAFWFVYLDIVFVMKPYNDFVYYIGFLLVLFVCTVALHRFWKEQYVFNLVGLLSLVLVLATHSGSSDRSYSDKAYILIIATILSSQIAIYYRRTFVGGIFERYNMMRTMLPQQVAFHLVTSDGLSSSGDLFSPKHRFAVCLSSDWRNFQKLCAERTPSEIAKLIETYYDVVSESLEIICPDGHYFSTWVADELFITFYSQTDNRSEVVSLALRFAHNLATSVYDKIHDRCGEKTLNYDIGVSSGLGLLGLLGPRQMKKATILGQVPGICKRLQEEAKKQRALLGVASPSLVVDEGTLASADHQAMSFLSDFRVVETSTKDIEHVRCLLWNSELKTLKATKNKRGLRRVS